MDWHGLRVYGIGLDLSAPPRGLFPGHHARGILGRALFDEVCLYSGHRDDRACAGCALRARCAYPQAFKPTEPDRLPPYWLRGWKRQSEGLRCDWHVLGAALPHMEAWLSGLLRHALDRRGSPLGAWDIATGAPLVERGALALDRLSPLPAPALPGGACHFQGLTPLASKHRGGTALYGALRTRVQRLIQHSGDGGRLPIEERPWEGTVESELAVDIGLDRRVLNGHLYRLEMRDISEPARELLAWGQRLNAGGHTSVGCGAYVLAVPG